MNLRIVILSRGRWENLTTDKVVKDATLVVPKSQLAEYKARGFHVADIVTSPDRVQGISAIRNFVLDAFKDEVIVMMDDDITSCRSLTGMRYRRLTISETMFMIANTAQCTVDAGLVAFGWNQAWDVRKYVAARPFALNTWLGGALGVVGRQFRWDEHFMLKADIDFSLQVLLKRRVLWTDQRFSFVQLRDRNAGGNASYRSVQRIEAEKARYREKWGPHISFKLVKSTERTSISVRRTGTLQLGR